jgi:hypothetical protein
MQPAYTLIAQPPFAVIIAYLVAAVVALTVFLRFRTYRMWEVALLVGVTGLANIAARSLQDWLLISLMLGVPHVSALLREARLSRINVLWGGPFGAWVFRLNRRCERLFYNRALRFQGIWPAGMVLAFGVVSLLPPLARRMPIQDSNEWPVAAVDWIQANDLHGRFFAMPDFESYLAWRLGDRAKIYVDTRGFFFPPELIEDSHFVPRVAPGWESRMERVLDYGTDYFLLETNGDRAALWRALKSHVDTPLYRDDATVLLSREQVAQSLPRIAGAFKTAQLLPRR